MNIGCLDLSDIYKLLVVSKGRHFSGVVAEKWIGKDSSKVGEDLKVLLSQLSATRGLKQSPGALYEELEEERNASTIASDQTMAMITKLQEKKAVLHMEALQQLRTMEEQAEYDNEALQKTDNLIVEKEKEIQDLEAEAESFLNTRLTRFSFLFNL